MQTVYMTNDSCLEYMKNCPNLMVRKQPRQTMGNRSDIEVNRHFTKEDKRMTNTHKEIHSTLLVIGKMIMKTTLKDYCTYIKIAVVI